LFACHPAQVDDDGHVVDFLQDPDGQKVRLTIDWLGVLAS
jgi:hypothetical protein